MLTKQHMEHNEIPQDGSVSLPAMVMAAVSLTSLLVSKVIHTVGSVHMPELLHIHIPPIFIEISQILTLWIGGVAGSLSILNAIGVDTKMYFNKLVKWFKCTWFYRLFKRNKKG